MPIKANLTRTEQSWTLNWSIPPPPSVVLSKSPGGAPLADPWAFLLPRCGVSIIKAQHSQERWGPAVNFHLSEAIDCVTMREEEDTWRVPLWSITLTRDALITCLTARLQKTQPTPPLAKKNLRCWMETHKSDSFMSTLVINARVKAELLLWAAIKAFKCPHYSWNIVILDNRDTMWCQSIDSLTGQKGQQDGRKIFCVDELWPLNKCRQGCRFHYTLLKRTGRRVQRDMIGSEDCPGAPGLPEVIGAEAEEASHLVCIKHLRLDLFPRCTGLRLCLPWNGSISPFAVAGNNYRDNSVDK